MLFGVNYCRRRSEKRRRQGGGGVRALLMIMLAGIAVGLLFLAPQWLLVLLVIALTGAVAALVCLQK